MKNDIFAFWYCNRTIFLYAFLFSVGVAMVALFRDTYALPIGIILMAFVAASIRWRGVPIDDSPQKLSTQEDNIESEVMRMWEREEPSWALEVATLVSIVIFLGTLVLGAYFKTVVLPALAH